MFFFSVPFSFDEKTSNIAQKEVHNYGFINHYSPFCRGYSLIAFILPDIPIGTSINS